MPQQLTSSNSSSVMKPEPSVSKCWNADIKFSRLCSFPRNTVAVKNSCRIQTLQVSNKTQTPSYQCCKYSTKTSSAQMLHACSASSKHTWKSRVWLPSKSTWFMIRCSSASATVAPLRRNPADKCKKAESRAHQYGARSMQTVYRRCARPLTLQEKSLTWFLQALAGGAGQQYELDEG